jgi:hypothetical protein
MVAEISVYVFDGVNALEKGFDADWIELRA